MKHYFFVETFNCSFVQVTRSEFISILKSSRSIKSIFPYKLELFYQQTFLFNVCTHYLRKSY